MITLSCASDRRADGSLGPLNSIRDCLYIYVETNDPEGRPRMSTSSEALLPYGMLDGRLVSVDDISVSPESNDTTSRHAWTRC